MDPARWERVKEIFDEASETAGATRMALIQLRANGDTEVEQEVLALLTQSEQAGEGFLSSPIDPGPAANVFRPGDLVAGRYRIEKFLAAGGMGEVYAAEDSLLHTRIALKTVHSAIVRDEQARRRFRQEIQTARMVAHHHVCRVFDIGVHGHAPPAAQCLFLTMELLEGETLAAYLKRGNRYTLEQAVPILRALTEGVQAAHDVQVIHRDLKPSNIFLTSASTGPRVVVTDFGLARDTSETPRRSSTHDSTASLMSGLVMGTPAYMAPELLQGGRASVASDIYALGVVMYEMAVGKRPFESDTPFAEALKKVKGLPPPPSRLDPAIDPRWERAILRCLNPDPAQRFPAVRDVYSALTGAVAAPLPAQRAPRHWWVAGTVAAALALGAGYWALSPRKPASTVLTGVPASASAELLVRPLTSQRGVESYPAFSPDGQRLAFAGTGENSANVDIYVTPIDAERLVRLTSSPDLDVSPAFSADGQSLAFIRRPAGGTSREGRRCSDGTLWVMSADGRNERPIPAGTRVQHVTWSPAAELIYSECDGEGMTRNTIYGISLTTGVRRVIAASPEGTRGYPSFALSPDGASLAMTRWLASPSTELVVRPLEGGAERVLFRDPSLVSTLAWSPDGAEIIYSAQADGRERLSRLNAAGPSDRPHPIPGIEPGASNPAIHPSGRLAFSRSAQNVDVWRYDLASGGAAPVIASTRRDSSAQVSPDGRRLVFSSDRSGMSDLWVADTHGGNLLQITRNMPRSGAPAWSPDSKWIAFDSMAKGSKELWVVSADGSGLRQLTNEEKVEEGRTAFSTDGQWIFHRSDRSGTRQIWKVPVMGGAPIQVTKNGGEEPHSSLDGKFVYYARDRRAPGIWRVPVDGGPETLVASQPYFGYWDVTSTGIYYLDLSSQDGPHAIMLHDFATGQSRRVGLVKKPINRELPGFSISRDGHAAFVLQVESMEGDIYLVDGFR